MIGEEVAGLVGMDILSNFEVWFDRKLGDLMFFNETIFDTRRQGNTLMTIPTIELCVEGARANLILDSGAQYSYIADRFIAPHLKYVAHVTDFAPIVGLDSFEVSLFELSILVSNLNPQLSDAYQFTFGKMPTQLSMMLGAINMDGIVGVDFFKLFRVVLAMGHLAMY